jgi:hypothetical protein
MTRQECLASLRRPVLRLGLVALGTISLQACNRAPEQTPAAGTVATADTAQAAADPDTTGLAGSAATKPAYHFSSEEGSFQVFWPRGCGRLRIRANEPEVFAGEEPSHTVLVHHVACDQFGLSGAGCSVTATFDAPGTGGGPAGSDQVVGRVRNALTGYGVLVVRESQIRKEFEDGLVAEGVDVTGTGAEGTGEFWVRGLLVGPDIYVLTAWSQEGNLWQNPEYMKFFNGFLPFAE